MMNDGTGLRRTFFKNGKNYKRVARFRSEAEANRYVEQLGLRSESKRFEPVIERMRRPLWNGCRFGFTSYRVYIPIMEK